LIGWIFRTFAILELSESSVAWGSPGDSGEGSATHPHTHARTHTHTHTHTDTHRHTQTPLLNSPVLPSFSSSVLRKLLITCSESLLCALSLSLSLSLSSLSLSLSIHSL